MCVAQFLAYSKFFVDTYYIWMAYDMSKLGVKSGQGD